MGIASKSTVVADGPQQASGSEREQAFVHFGLTLRALFRVISRRRGRDTHLGGAEVSHAQFELLMALCEHGELPLGELASAADLAPATVTQMLDHLATAGHVERVRSEVDRRVVVSRLTPEGKRLIEERRTAWRQSWEAALVGFSADEMRTAALMLERLRNVFDEGL